MKQLEEKYILHKIPVWVEYVLLVVFVLIGSAIIFWPMFSSPSTVIHGLPGDSTGSIYNFWYWRHHGFSFFPDSKNYLLAYPVGTSTGGLTLLPGVLLFLPGIFLTAISNEIFAYNFLIILGMVLPAIGGYVFFRLIPFSRSISMILAAAFILAPYHQLSEMAWFGQSQLVGIPIAGIGVLKFHRQPSPRNFLYLALSIIVSFLTNAYIGLMAAVLILCGLIVAAILHRKQFARKMIALTWKVIAAVTALIAAVVTVLFLLISSVRGNVNRSLSELQVYGLRLSELFHPTPYSAFGDSRLGLKGISNLHGSNLVEVSHYVGLSVIGLSIGGFIVSLLKKKFLQVQCFASLLVVISFWFGASQGLKFGPINLFAPATLINQIAPFWRVYSRFGLLVFFGLLILAGIFLQYCSELILQRSLRAGMLFSVLIVLVFDLLIAVPGASTRLTVPKYVEFLSKQNAGVVMEYPLAGGNDILRYQRLLDQRTLGLPSVNGDYETDGRLIRLGLADPHEPKTIEGLSALNVRWVIIQDWAYQSAQLGMPQVDSQELNLRYEGEGVRIFELLPSKFAAIAWIEEGGFAQEIVNERLGQWVGAKSKVIVTQNQRGCVRVEFNMTRYAGISQINLKSANRDLQIQRDGITKFVIGPFNDKSEVVISSPDGEIPVPGPDPRKLTAWIDSNISVNSVACD